MSNNIIEKLMLMKKQIEKSKTEQAQIKGRIGQLMERLKAEFDCDSVTAGEKKLENLQKKINKVESQIEKGLEELEANYEW